MTVVCGTPGRSQVGSEYRLDLVHGGTWYDAEKSTGNRDDDWLCWAASAANVLAWTGWGKEAGFSDEDQIFAYLSHHWSDHPAGSPRETWRWWFSGINRDGDGARVIRPGGGFFPAITFPWKKWGHPLGSLFLGVGQHQLRRQPTILRDLLEHGYGVVLQIVRPLPDGSRDSHMVTLWGYRYDSTNPFMGIHVTDSDDDKKARLGQEAEDTLVYYPLSLDDDRIWWFSYRDKPWRILAAYGLLHASRYSR
ncbi:MAG: hypothetical protein RBS34_03665 [Desulfofustis sp.]|nr:hypothetical protein [Desulfofustis sp.]